jgi:putative transposase
MEYGISYVSLTSGIKARKLNTMNDHNSQALCIETEFLHSGVSVANPFIIVIEMDGKLTQIRCDNGPEFTSMSLASCCNAEKFELKYIQPDKPTLNVSIERFNRHNREDIKMLIGLAT